MARGFWLFCRFLLLAMALVGAWGFHKNDVELRELDRTAVLFSTALSGKADQSFDVTVGGFTEDEFRVALHIPEQSGDPNSWNVAHDWKVMVQGEGGAGVPVRTPGDLYGRSQVLAVFRPLEARQRIRVDLVGLPPALREGGAQLRVENHTPDEVRKSALVGQGAGKLMMIYGGGGYALMQLIALLSLGRREREPRD